MYWYMCVCVCVITSLLYAAVNTMFEKVVDRVYRWKILQEIEQIESVKWNEKKTV